MEMFLSGIIVLLRVYLVAKGWIESAAAHRTAGGDAATSSSSLSSFCRCFAVFSFDDVMKHLETRKF